MENRYDEEVFFEKYGEMRRPMMLLVRCRKPREREYGEIH